jgi:hypothetical protein
MGGIWSSLQDGVTLLRNTITGGYGGLISFGANTVPTSGEHNLLFTGDPSAGAGKVTTGSSNIALIGSGGLGYLSAGNVTGNNNVAMGETVLTTLTSGHENIIIGYQVGTHITTGYRNIIVGSTSDPEGVVTPIAGFDNILIGADLSLTGTGVSNVIGIGVAPAVVNSWTVGKLGKKQSIFEGSNAAMGASTLTAGTVTVSNTLVTATSRIFLTAQNASGTHGVLGISARVASTSFTITSSSGTDTRLIAWEIKEPS